MVNADNNTKEKQEEILFCYEGRTLRLVQDTYADNGKPYFGLEVADTGGDEDLEPGEMWCDVTVNVPGLAEDEFALDNTFVEFSPPDLVADVLAVITENGEKERTVVSLFSAFQIYKYKETILEKAQETKEMENDTQNQREIDNGEETKEPSKTMAGFMKNK